MIDRTLSAHFGRNSGLAPRLAALLLVLCCVPAAALAQFETEVPEASLTGPEAGEHKTLNLNLNYKELVEAEEKKQGKAAEGSFRAAQDVADDAPRGRNWSRSVGKSWQMDPVVADYRQDGQPIKPDDNEPPKLREDQTHELLGVEFLKKF